LKLDGNHCWPQKNAPLRAVGESLIPVLTGVCIAYHVAKFFAAGASLSTIPSNVFVKIVLHSDFECITNINLIETHNIVFAFPLIHYGRYYDR
jgi:hypothetical protein